MKLVKTSELPWAKGISRGNYQQRRKECGGERLKAGLYELAPGKKSWPLHAHLVTEEALYVVSGRAKVRTPEGLTDIGPGDYVSFPPGGPAHQLVNDGDAPLVYLGLSAGTDFDSCEYPDTDKISIAVGTGPSRKRFLFKRGSAVDYFEGDEDA